MKNSKFENIRKNPYFIGMIVAGVLLAVLLIRGIGMAVSSPSDGDVSTHTSASGKGIQTISKTGSDFDAAKDVVVIEMENGGIIKIELYPDQAPITVANFVKLVNEDFYNNLKFHRVIKGFMIQGGDPYGDGTGGASEKIKGEFSSNGVNNTISHIRGVISMARGSSENSASSQFFIMHGDTTSLDGDYAAFGCVIEGMDVVDAIANVKCDNSNPQAPVPLKDQRMKDVRIETRAE